MMVRLLHNFSYISSLSYNSLLSSQDRTSRPLTEELLSIIMNKTVPAEEGIQRQVMLFLRYSIKYVSAVCLVHSKVMKQQ